MQPNLNVPGAVLSVDKRFRYLLWRPIVDPHTVGSGTVAFVMLNPSTADATQDDPTIRRCVGFAAQWGYRRLVVANLFALRATNPRDLYAAPDPVGPKNDAWLLWLARHTEMIVCAWGVHGALHERGTVVASLLRGMARDAPPCPFIRCLGHTKHGQPKHPLYLSKTTQWEAL